PAVTARRALDRLGIFDERARKELDESIDRAIVRIVNAQNPDGGWGWWPQQGSDPAMTALALNGLEAAREAGIFVDAGVLDRARQAAASLMSTASNDVHARAALLRALARSQRAQEGDLNRMLRTAEESSLRIAAELALACADQGRTDLGQRAVDRVKQLAGAGFTTADNVAKRFYDAPNDAAAATILALLRYEPRHPLVDAAMS